VTPPDHPTGQWAVVLGASSGSGAAIARAVAREPGLHVFGVHRGHFPDEARALEDELRALGRRAYLHVGDAGDSDGALAGATLVGEVAGPRSVAGRRVELHAADAGLPDRVASCADLVEQRLGRRRIALVVHALSGASLGHFLSTRGDAFQARQFEKTFNYLAHSFVYWARALHERNLLAPGARLLGLTNLLHDSLLHNCGLVAAAKAALQMYVRHLGRACTFEDLGRVVSFLAREEGGWFNGATIDYTGGMTLRLLDIILRPD
jgi:NAD(P)-dependent dehydrogenase (short-subunit alcohol dehydrogenase family)